MLTVKIIKPDSSEWIHEAFSVSQNTPEQSASKHASVSCFLTDKTCLDVYAGTVYVMNENGKTVANYDLGNPPMECGG